MDNLRLDDTFMAVYKAEYLMITLDNYIYMYFSTQIYVLLSHLNHLYSGLEIRIIIFWITPNLELRQLRPPMGKF